MSRLARVLLRLAAVLVGGVLVGLPAPGLSVLSPAAQHTGRVWASITSGHEHSCGIRLDQSLWCWGLNGSGDLGLGDYQERSVPTRVGDAEWALVDASDNSHTCGVQVDGSLWCWGYNLFGQLGTGDFDVRLLPTRVESGGQWTAVSTGYGDTCAIRADGSLWCWGENDVGQLGIGSDAYKVPDPTRVDGGSRWLSVTTGAFHTCGLHEDHSLWCWGAGSDGELGLGDGGQPHDVPVRVGKPTDWTGVSAGYAFTCGVRAAHTLWCWGHNFSGELGVGDRSNRYVPTRLVGKFWATVSNGADHACALSTDGGLFCWGEGSHGRLGYGGTADQVTPLRIGTRSDWMLLATGGFHSCAIRTSHGLLCWGWNLRGQLGLGSQVGRAVYPKVV